MSIKINIDKDFIIGYVLKQLNNVLPDGFNARPVLESVIEHALERTVECVSAIRVWNSNEFNYLISGQYATFLYILSNDAWKIQGCAATATRLFLLNKALNGLELFYEVELPPHFYIGHTNSLVFAKATYGDYCVFYQNCTVGRKHDMRPVIAQGLVMYPGSMIIGNCNIRENTILAPGVCLVDQDTPGNCYVLTKKSGNGTVFKSLSRCVIADYFNQYSSIT